MPDRLVFGSPGLTPLMNAALERDADKVKALIGVDDPKTVASDGRSALHFALSVMADSTKDPLECVRLLAPVSDLQLIAPRSRSSLSDEEAPASPLQLAAYHQHLACVSVLAPGSDVNALGAVQTIEGHTALMTLQAEAMSESEDLLLAMRALLPRTDLTIKNAVGVNALRLAASNAHREGWMTPFELLWRSCSAPVFDEDKRQILDNAVLDPTAEAFHFLRFMAQRLLRPERDEGVVDPAFRTSLFQLNWARMDLLVPFAKRQDVLALGRIAPRDEMPNFHRVLEQDELRRTLFEKTSDSSGQAPQSDPNLSPGSGAGDATAPPQRSRPSHRL